MKRVLLSVLGVALSLVINNASLAQCGATEDQLIAPADGKTGDEFCTVSLDGDVLLVGASGHDHPNGQVGAGALYVYRGTNDGGSWTWVFEQKLLATTPGAGDALGDRPGSRSGDVVVVGAPKDDDKGPTSGSAWIFRYSPTTSTWSFEQQLLAWDGSDWDYFGEAVSVSGNYLGVASPEDDDVGPDSGSVYMYSFDATQPPGMQWTLEQKLFDPDPGDRTEEFFGSMLSLSGNWLVVGAPGDDDTRPVDGSALVFRYDQTQPSGSRWLFEQRLKASMPDAYDFFGSWVSLDGNVIVVGAGGDDDNGSEAGAAYVFRHDASQPAGQRWVSDGKLTASDGTSGDEFGVTVDASGNTILVGSDSDAMGSSSGAAYEYHYDGTGWVEKRKVVASNGQADDSFGIVAVDGRQAVVGAQEGDGAQPDSGAGYAFGIADLALHANQDSVIPGDALTLTTCGGLQGDFNLLAVVDVNGTPTFQTLALETFDSLGQHTFGNTVPSGLSGLTVGFMSMGFYQPGKIGLSNVETVEFL